MRRLLFFLTLTLVLTACAPARPEDPAALVLAMAGEHPVAGRLYFADAADIDREAKAVFAMPDSLIAAAYGEGSVPPIFAGLEAYAVRFSAYAEPDEVGCFVVSREQDAEAVAAMCHARMTVIARLCGSAAIPEPPLIVGRTVVYATGSDAAAALDRARAILHG